jgi:hypothetical protein
MSAQFVGISEEWKPGKGKPNRLAYTLKPLWRWPVRERRELWKVRVRKQLFKGRIWMKSE